MKMDGTQKWCVVGAVWVLAIGVLFIGVGLILNSFTGRYRWPELEESFVTMHPDCRWDTWTGQLETRQARNGRFRYETGASSWIKNVK